MGYGLDASTAKFELVTVLNLPMLFTCCRVDQDTVPEDLYIYEVSHDANVRGKPVQISEWIRVNHCGTLLTSKPIRLDKTQKHSEPTVRLIRKLTGITKVAH